MSSINKIPQSNIVLNNNNNLNNQSVFSQFEKILVSSSSTDPVVYNPALKKNRKRSIAIKLGIAALLFGGVLALSSRKFRLNTVELLESLNAQSETLLNKSKETIVNKEMSLFLKVRIAVFGFINRLTNYFINILGNLDHGKNFLTGKIADKIPFGRKVTTFLNDKFKPFFTGSVTTAATDKYKTLDKAVLNLNKTLKEVSAKSPELQNTISSTGDDIVASLGKLSGNDAIDTRLKELNTLLKGAVKDYNSQINNIVSDTNIGNTTKSLLNSTISIDIAKNHLLQRDLKLLDLKRALSFNHDEKVKTLIDLLNDMTYLKNVKPDSALIQNFKTAIQNYSKTATDANKDAVLKVLKDASEVIKQPKISRAIAEAESAIITSKPGLLQQLAQNAESAYKKGAIDADDFNRLSKQIGAVQTKLEKAVKFEKNNLAGRLLDLEIGPTPLLETSALVIPAGILAHECAQSETKQEAISKSIKYGPAIVGGVGTIVYASNKGLFGYKALLFGAVTGYIFNKIGEFVDNKYYSKGKEWDTLKVLSSNKTNDPRVRIIEI